MKHHRNKIIKFTCILVCSLCESGVIIKAKLAGALLLYFLWTFGGSGSIVYKMGPMNEHYIPNKIMLDMS